MTSEHINPVPEGRHAATRPDNAVEVGPTGYHYDDRARLASYRRTAPRPPAAPAGAAIALLVCLTVMYAEWALYAQTLQGQSDATWALGFMIVSTGASLRILMGNPGRHVVSGAVILVSGVGLLFRALVVTRDSTFISAFEIASGALLVVAALMTLLSPTLEPESPPERDPWG